MKKCCETCRFFAKGALAGSGWCRHPERVDVNNDLVLVRASQLTCRRGWDQDSWQPISRETRSRERFPRDLQIGPVQPVSQSDFNAIINADRGTMPPSVADMNSSLEEDRVVETITGSLPKVPNSLIAKQLSTTPEIPAPEPDADEVMDERWMRAAKEGVKKARITNRIRPMVEPLPSSNQEGVAASPSERSDPPVDSSEALDDEGAGRTNQNSIAIEPHHPVEESRPTVSPPPSAAPIDFETGIELDPRESMVPSIPPSFDHWDHDDDRSTPMLWLVQGVNSRRVEAPQRSLLPHYMLDDVEGDDVVVNPNLIINEQPFELPPIVESFRPPVARIEEEPERARPKQRRKRQSANVFGSRWATARERPSMPTPPPVEQWLAPDSSEVLAAVSSDPDIEAIAPEVGAFSLPPEAHRFDELMPYVHKPEITNPLRIDPDSPSSQEVAPSIWIESPLEPATWDVEDRIVRVEAHVEFGGRAPIEAPDVIVESDVVVRNIVSGPIVYDGDIDRYVIAPEVPRMCQTCSAFRPADDGERGWCSNTWAFEHPQVVSAWELPCASSFGTWWIPVDTAWQDEVLERRDTPTPLYDQLMAMKPEPRKERSFIRKRWS